MKIQSEYLLLDVKQGRRALAKKVSGGCKIPVVIHATIDLQHGNDDGGSIEFMAKVQKVEVLA